MATQVAIAELRRLVDDSSAPFMFENGELSTVLAEAGDDPRKAAGAVWGVKASRYAGLVDVTEGASSRKNSQLYKQALEMAGYYGGESATPGGGSSGARSGTRRIVRP